MTNFQFIHKYRFRPIEVVLFFRFFKSTYNVIMFNYMECNFKVLRVKQLC